MVDFLEREPALARALAIDIGFTAILGIVLIIGGNMRMKAHAFDFVHLTGGPYVWGATLIVLALLITLTRRWSRTYLRWALTLGAAIHALFGGCFLLAALADPAHTVSFIPAVLFFWNSFRLMSQSSAFRARHDTWSP